MQNMKELYCDGLAKINFSNGMIHCDFANLSPNDSGASPTQELRFHLILPLNGFLRLSACSQELVTRLLDKGVFRKKKNIPESLPSESPVEVDAPKKTRKPAGKKAAAKPADAGTEEKPAPKRSAAKKTAVKSEPEAPADAAPAKRGRSIRKVKKAAE